MSRHTCHDAPFLALLFFTSLSRSVRLTCRAFRVTVYRSLNDPRIRLIGQTTAVSRDRPFFPLLSRAFCIISYRSISRARVRPLGTNRARRRTGRGFPVLLSERPIDLAPIVKLIFHAMARRLRSFASRFGLRFRSVLFASSPQRRREAVWRAGMHGG